MAFDAGSVEATLSIDTAKADADLKKIEAQVKALEDSTHKIKISAVFDNAATGKARAAFAALDNAISRDAMQRLRSSPQGSVLGSLNALFSPHPVSGAPSPQQAASQGLLGKMFGPTGGGSTALPGSESTVRNVLTGQQAAAGNAPQRVIVTQGGGGQGGSGGGVSDQATRDLEDAAGDTKDAATAIKDASADGKDAASAGKDASAGIRSAASGLGDAASHLDDATTGLRAASSGLSSALASLHGLLGTGGGGGGGGGD